MAVKSTTKSTTKAELYVAFQAGCTELPDGGDFTWHRGDRLRADHPAVKRLGRSAFVPEGTPRDEIPNLFEDGLSKMPEPSRDDGVRALTQRYRCLKNVRADVDGKVLTAKKGDMLEPNDDLVRIAPASFQAVSVPA
jgi:hypothetical protein